MSDEHARSSTGEPGSDPAMAIAAVRRRVDGRAGQYEHEYRVDEGLLIDAAQRLVTAVEAAGAMADVVAAVLQVYSNCGRITPMEEHRLYETRREFARAAGELITQGAGRRPPEEWAPRETDE